MGEIACHIRLVCAMQKEKNPLPAAEVQRRSGGGCGGELEGGLTPPSTGVGLFPVYDSGRMRQSRLSCRGPRLGLLRPMSTFYWPLLLGQAACGSVCKTVCAWVCDVCACLTRQ